TVFPCGHCRQFLHEMAAGRNIRILVPGESPAALTDLLPRAFDLGFPPRTPWEVHIASEDELVLSAGAPGQKSCAPYSKSASGAAIRSSRGAIYLGAYLENAAFNPSLGPMQVALCAMASDGWHEIDDAVLVERKGAPISQAAAARALVEKLRVVMI